MLTHCGQLGLLTYLSVCLQGRSPKQAFEHNFVFVCERELTALFQTFHFQPRMFILVNHYFFLPHMTCPEFILHVHRSLPVEVGGSWLE